MLSYASFISALRALTERAAEPKYVAVRPDTDSIEVLVELAEVIQLPSSLMVPETELHCTVTYSRTPVDDPSKEIQKMLPIEATGDEWALFGEGGKCLVLKLSSVGLRALHAMIKKDFGASHDFPTYEPHVTLCSEVPEGFKLPDMKPNVKLTFTRYEVSRLDE